MSSNNYMQAFVGVALALGSSSPVAADPKREPPSYDGRGNTDADADSWALWIPRVALSPLYFVSEYGIRRPLGALVTTAERHHWVSSISDFFTFGPSGNYVLLPTALFDFGLLPSVGFYFSGDGAWVAGNMISVHAATWGADWINATVRDRLTWNAGTTSLGVRADFKREGDLVFVGIGPDVITDMRARYGLQRFEAGASFTQRISGESAFTLSSGVRAIGFRPAACCGDPSLESRIADGSLPMPPGYGVDYTTLYQRADITLDTRAARPASATGGYLEMHGETNFDVRNDRRWVEYGATVGVALDVLNRQRTVKAQLAVDYTDPLRGGVVPFNELASLGGNLMPGFVAGWMTGRSVIAGQLGYTWPVWMWLDGQARLSTGNAFGSHLDDFAVQKLRLSADLGVTTVGKRDAGFEILVGVGTETIEDGAALTSFRLSFGSRKGF